MQPNGIPRGTSGKGKASNGKDRILDIKPTELHQRMPFFVGTKAMVEQAEAFMAQYSDEE